MGLHHAQSFLSDPFPSLCRGTVQSGVHHALCLRVYPCASVAGKDMRQKVSWAGKDKAVEGSQL